MARTISKAFSEAPNEEFAFPTASYFLSPRGHIPASTLHLVIKIAVVFNQTCLSWQLVSERRHLCCTLKFSRGNRA